MMEISEGSGNAGLSVEQMQQQDQSAQPTMPVFETQIRLKDAEGQQFGETIFNLTDEGIKGVKTFEEIQTTSAGDSREDIQLTQGSTSSNSDLGSKEAVKEPQTQEKTLQEFHRALIYTNIKKYAFKTTDDLTKQAVVKSILPAMKHVCLQGQRMVLAERMSEMEKENNLTALQALNLSFQIKNQDDEIVMDHLNDLDSIMVTMKLYELKKNQRASDIIYLLDWMINLSTFGIRSLKKPDQLYQLVVTVSSKGQRSLKKLTDYDKDEFDVQKLSKKVGFDDNFKLHQEYSNMWAARTGKMLPSPLDILKGLKEYFFTKFVNDDSNQQSEYYKKQIRFDYTKVFEKIVELMKFSDPSKQFVYGSNGEMDLQDPSGKAVSFVWWLASIEPSFFTAMNQAIRSQDEELLMMLGPLARVTFIILTFVPNEKLDGIDRGYDVLQANPNHSMGTFCSSFLLFRTVQMPNNQLAQWYKHSGKKAPQNLPGYLEVEPSTEQRRGKSKGKNKKQKDEYPQVRMLGPTITFENALAALDFGQGSDTENKTVMFVMCMQNYFRFNGFRIGHPKYSSHFREGMTVLREGTEFQILDINEEISGKESLTTIYLLNTHRYHKLRADEPTDQIFTPSRSISQTGNSEMNYELNQPVTPRSKRGENNLEIVDELKVPITPNNKMGKSPKRDTYIQRASPAKKSQKCTQKSSPDILAGNNVPLSIHNQDKSPKQKICILPAKMRTTSKAKESSNKNRPDWTNTLYGNKRIQAQEEEPGKGKKSKVKHSTSKSKTSTQLNIVNKNKNQKKPKAAKMDSGASIFESIRKLRQESTQYSPDSKGEQIEKSEHTFHTRFEKVDNTLNTTNDENNNSGYVCDKVRKIRNEYSPPQNLNLVLAGLIKEKNSPRVSIEQREKIRQKKKEEREQSGSKKSKSRRGTINKQFSKMSTLRLDKNAEKTYQQPGLHRLNSTTSNQSLGLRRQHSIQSANSKPLGLAIKKQASQKSNTSGPKLQRKMTFHAKKSISSIDDLNNHDGSRSDPARIKKSFQQPMQSDRSRIKLYANNNRISEEDSQTDSQLEKMYKQDLEILRIEEENEQFELQIKCLEMRMGSYMQKINDEDEQIELEEKSQRLKLLNAKVRQQNKKIEMLTLGIKSHFQENLGELKAEVKQAQSQLNRKREEILHLKKNNEVQRQQIERAKQAKQYDEQIEYLRQGVEKQKQKTRDLQKMKLQNISNFGQKYTEFNEKWQRNEIKRLKVERKRIYILQMTARSRSHAKGSVLSPSRYCGSPFRSPQTRKGGFESPMQNNFIQSAMSPRDVDSKMSSPQKDYQFNLDKVVGETPPVNSRYKSRESMFSNESSIDFKNTEQVSPARDEMQSELSTEFNKNVGDMKIDECWDNVLE